MFSPFTILYTYLKKKHIQDTILYYKYSSTKTPAYIINSFIVNIYVATRYYPDF